MVILSAQHSNSKNNNYLNVGLIADPSPPRSRSPSSLSTPEKKGESLEVDRAWISARALLAFRAKDKAVAGWAEARARDEERERSAKGRVRELEEEEARLRREYGTRADAAQASKYLPERSLAVVAA